MPETIYELAKRMCNSFKSCDDCPMNKAKDDCCLIDLIVTHEVKEVAGQLAMMYEWAHANPTDTYKTVFLKAFPSASLSPNGYPEACRYHIFGGKCPGMDMDKRNVCWNAPKCDECWDEPYRKDENEDADE